LRTILNTAEFVDDVSRQLKKSPEPCGTGDIASTHF
jgi:hypothetical protein